MHEAIFRVALAGGATRLAAGAIAGGPAALLPDEVSLDTVLSRPGGFAAALAAGERGGPGERGQLDGHRLLAPVQSQEVWAAGVTYRRSRQARVADWGASCGSRTAASC